MVDVVDLLGESSDDEAGPTKPCDNDTVATDTPAARARAPSSSSSWLRDVVANSYGTTPQADTAPPAPITISATKRPAATPKSKAIITQNDSDDDDDDEVLWVPGPVARAASAIKNTATKTTKRTAEAAVSVPKASMMNINNDCNDDDDDDDDDVEVLVVDPPTAARLQQTKTFPSSAAWKPQSSATSRERAASMKRNSKPPRVSQFDSDDDDDDFLLQSRPIFLTQPSKNESSKRKGANQTPDAEPWRKQFQNLTNASNVAKKRKSRSASTDSTALTPSSSSTNAGSRNVPSGGSTKPSASKESRVLRNPYAKPKTPPGSQAPSAAQKPSGSRPVSSMISSSLDLLSPLAAMRPSVAVNNPYSSSSSSRKSGAQSSRLNTAATTAAKSANTSTPTAPTELAPGVYVPKLRERTKQYPDIRPNILLALWKFARSNLVRDSYEGRRLDKYVGRIVDLGVAAPDFPIRSLGEFAVRKRTHLSKKGYGGLTVGGDSIQRFADEMSSTGVMKSRFSHFPGKYFTISEACLVAMKETIVRRWKHNEQQQQRQQQRAFPVDGAYQAALFSQKCYYVSLVELIPQIDRRLRPECPSRLERKGDDDGGASYYLDKSTRSAEFKQVEKLLAPVEIVKPDGSVKTTSYLKRRLVNKRQHYQLTPLGFQKAVMIARRSLPAPMGPYRSSNLFAVLPKYDPICLAVDFREGGGGDGYHKVLHEMCNKLDLQKIPYCVNTLKIGDYCFFSGNKLCPILVERKSVEDVAQSISEGDGRWVSQKLRMYQGQFVFGYQNCRIAYIIEGKVERSLVSNGFVGSCRHKVSKEQFEEEVANLEDEGFEVLRTCSVENSMLELSRWAESVAEDVKSGRLPLRFTYDEFVREINKIPKTTDFSRLARDHARQRKKKRQEASATVDLLSDGESDGGHEVDLRPMVLDERLRKTEKRTALENSARSKVGTGARKRFRLDGNQRNEVGRRPPVERSAPRVARSSGKIGCLVETDGGDGHGIAKNEYAKWTATALKEKCVELGMKKSGSKIELIERLLDLSNRPPPVYRLRKQRGLYVPAKPDTASTAILVAIQIEQDCAPAGVERYAGLTKDEIYVMAEKLDIKKDPFCGGTTQTGPYDYDGWSSMRFLKESGDPPLVVEKKRRFRLSVTGDVSGLKLARDMHVWCHKKGICRCIEEGYEYDPKKWR